MPLECSICLSSFKDPVCIPCGHIYCTKCLTDHVNLPTNDDLSSSCPTCRTQFTTVMPDLTYLPRKYHQYVIPSVRRVYIDTSSEKTLKKKLTQAEDRIRSLEKEKANILVERDRYKSSIQTHVINERDAILKAKAGEDRLNRLARQRNEDNEVAVRDLNEAFHERDHIQAQYNDLFQQFHELTQKFNAQATKLEDKERKSQRQRSSVPQIVSAMGSTNESVVGPSSQPLTQSTRDAWSPLPQDWAQLLSQTETRVQAGRPVSPSLDPPLTQPGSLSRKIRPLPRLRRTREDSRAEQSFALPPHYGKRPRYSEPGPSSNTQP